MKGIFKEKVRLPKISVRKKFSLYSKLNPTEMFGTYSVLPSAQFGDNGCCLNIITKSSGWGCCLICAYLFPNFSLVLLIKVLLIKKACNLKLVSHNENDINTILF